MKTGHKESVEEYKIW